MATKRRSGLVVGQDFSFFKAENQPSEDPTPESLGPAPPHTNLLSSSIPTPNKIESKHHADINTSKQSCIAKPSTKGELSESKKQQSQTRSRPTISDFYRATGFSSCKRAVLVLLCSGTSLRQPSDPHRHVCEVNRRAKVADCIFNLTCDSNLLDLYRNHDRYGMLVTMICSLGWNILAFAWPQFALPGEYLVPRPVVLLASTLDGFGMMASSAMVLNHTFGLGLKPWHPWAMISVGLLPAYGIMKSCHTLGRNSWLTSTWGWGGGLS